MRLASLFVATPINVQSDRSPGASRRSRSARRVRAEIMVLPPISPQSLGVRASPDDGVRTPSGDHLELAALR